MAGTGYMEEVVQVFDNGAKIVRNVPYASPPPDVVEAAKRLNIEHDPEYILRDDIETVCKWVLGEI